MPHVHEQVERCRISLLFFSIYRIGGHKVLARLRSAMDNTFLVWGFLGAKSEYRLQWRGPWEGIRESPLLCSGVQDMFMIGERQKVSFLTTAASILSLSNLRLEPEFSHFKASFYFFDFGLAARNSE